TGRQLAGVAELADGRAVQLSLVDLARARPGARPVAVGVGVGHEEILVRPFGDAVGPGGAVLGIGRLPFQIVVQHHIAVVAAIGDIDIALVIHLQAVGQVVFILALAAVGTTILGEEFSFRRIFQHPVVAVAVGDKDVVLLVPGHVGGPAQRVVIVGRIGTVR